MTHRDEVPLIESLKARGGIYEGCEDSKLFEAFRECQDYLLPEKNSPCFGLAKEQITSYSPLSKTRIDAGLEGLLPRLS